MYSYRYIYYNIQSDGLFTQEVARETLVTLLLATDCFLQKGPQSFSNKPPFPWISLDLFKTEDGNYALQETPIPFVNLIAVVGLKSGDVDGRLYTDVLKALAGKLGWKLYLEEDEDGNENVEIL
jgi:hypothetical protein